MNPDQFFDDLTAEAFPERKTKAVADALARWGVADGEHALLITSASVPTVADSARNIGALVHSTVAALSVYDVLRADKLVVEASAVAWLNNWFGSEGEACLAKWFRATNLSPVFWSTTAACRWENVPRSTSWPLHRDSSAQLSSG